MSLFGTSGPMEALVQDKAHDPDLKHDIGEKLLTTVEEITMVSNFSPISYLRLGSQALSSKGTIRSFCPL